MKSNTPRRASSRFVLAALLVGCGAVAMQSCGGSTSKKVAPDFEAGAAGEGASVEQQGGRGGAGGSNHGGANAAGNGDTDAAGSGNVMNEGGSGGAPEPPTSAGAGGTANEQAAGTGGGSGEGGAVCENASTGGRIKIAFDTANAERVTNLQWVDSASQTTVNMIGQGGTKYCNDPIEFFGQSYGAPEGTLPSPVVAGYLSTLAQCGLDTTITSAAQSCNPAGVAQTPVTTQYHFYDGSRASQVRITRTIGFDASTPFYANTVGVRPFVPRVSLGVLPTVIYPNKTGTGITTVASTACGGDCFVPVGPTWNGKWFADINDAGLALIVVRDPTMTAPVDLTVNNDANSNANLSSFVLLEPPNPGWQAPVTEVEYLCFADLTSWPQAQRTAAQLPANCEP